ISDGEHPEILTLGPDTVASLATDGSEYNASSGAAINGEDELAELVRLSELLGTNGTNETTEEREAEVVVVRAEQKRPGDAEQKRTEPREVHLETEDQQREWPKSPTTAPELNDSAARAQLTGSADDSTAAILDSLVTTGPGSSEPHEDMPSFNEWAQKRLVEEAEKKKTHPNASVQTANGVPVRGLGGIRMRSKNYASPDCGAKVVAATPESSNARNILVSSRDEYMLNACTTRVWFAVELCEAIQARKIDL
ncbi:SUN domain-containing ossification factor-like, partial [Copidosoma floridanum]|uniref:SUN domain-containing ossification factor-like n=1 Tax=Copidosoma floridanum TaxID=29053 RepID=UPI0006C987D0